MVAKLNVVIHLSGLCSSNLGMFFQSSFLSIFNEFQNLSGPKKIFRLVHCGIS